MKKLVKEQLNEKFTKDSDPITDLGIGMLYVIKNWAKKYYTLDIENIPYADIFKKCIMYEKEEFIDYLLDSGTVDINQQNEMFLRLAIFNQHYKIALKLLSKGANIDDAMKYSDEQGEIVTLSNFYQFKKILKENEKNS